MNNDNIKELSRDEALDMKRFGIYVVSSDELELSAEAEYRLEAELA